MSIDVTIESDRATFAARPPHGRPVTFVVEQRDVNVANPTRSYYWSKRIAPRFVVGLKGGNGNGFSHHTSFEEACKRALSRARRYDKAYSQPRGVIAASRLERAS
jgi:hypothetical protein